MLESDFKFTKVDQHITTNTPAMDFTIGLIGEISSGKSSLNNSLNGDYIASGNVLRETFMPTKYIFLPNIPVTDYSRVVKSKTENKDRRDGRIKSKIPDIDNVIKVSDRFSDLHGKYINVIDFPGLDDGNESAPKGQYIQNIRDHMGKLDMVMFVTKAESAFTKQTEKDCFKQVLDIINEHRKLGRYIDLVIVDTKFDNEQEDEYNEMYNDMTRFVSKYGSIKTFRFSSHCHLVSTWMADVSFAMDFPPELRSDLTRIFKNSGIMYTGKAPRRVTVPTGDHDGLITYISNEISTIREKRANHAYETLKKHHSGIITVHADDGRKLHSNYNWDGGAYTLKNDKSVAISSSDKTITSNFNDIMGLAMLHDLRKTHGDKLLELCTEPYYYEKFGLKKMYEWDGEYSTIGDAIYMYSTYTKHKRPTDELLRLVSMSMEQDNAVYRAKREIKFTMYGPNRIAPMPWTNMVSRRAKIIQSDELLKTLDKLTNQSANDLQAAIIRNEIDFERIDYPHITCNIKLIAAKLAPNNWVNMTNINGCYKSTKDLVSFDD